MLTDLEFRLKNGEAARAEEYLERFDTLRSVPGVELQLITAEVDLRRRREPELPVESFLARFPQYEPELKRVVMGLYSSTPTVRLRPGCSPSDERLVEPGGVIRKTSFVPSSDGQDPRGRESFAASLPGQLRLGKYELLDELGCGAYGIVYRARDTELDRIVALKTLQAVRRLSPGAADRFVREARNAARLNHPHIVSIHDFECDGENSYLVYAYVPGTTLARHMAGTERLPVREIATVIYRMAEALHYAHLRGVIHRDVKPANILIDHEGEPYLTDFGLALREAGDVTITVEGEILGTPAYMSPEQARGEGHRVDGRTDIYSLGVILYQLLTGVLPFRGTSGHIILKRLLNEEPRRPRRFDATIPRELETICLKCLEKKPGNRFPDAGVLAADLRRFLEGQPILARGVGRAARAGRWCRRKPAVASLSLALVLAAAAGLAFSARQIRATRTSDALARASATKAEKLLRGSVGLLQAKLTRAKDRHRSLSFMRADDRNDLLRDITDLRLLVADESHRSLTALRLRALYILGWGYSLTEDIAKARESLTEAITLGMASGSAGVENLELGGILAECHNLLANLFHSGGSPAEAGPHYQHAIRLCKTLVERQPQSPGPRASLGETLIDQANHCRDRGLPDEARALYLEAHRIFNAARSRRPREFPLPS